MINYFKKLETDVAILKNFNSRVVDQLVQTKRQWWENVQSSRHEWLELREIPTSIEDDVLEDKVCNIFRELDVELDQGDIQVCHWIKKNRTIIKLSNRKDFLQSLRPKKRLKNIDGTILAYRAIPKSSLTKVFLVITGGRGTSVNA